MDNTYLSYFVCTPTAGAAGKGYPFNVEGESAVAITVTAS